VCRSRPHIVRGAVDDARIPARIIAGDFRGWLRDAMNARHMSPRMVGRQTGLDPTAVARLLYGGRQPTLMTLMALIELFDDEAGRPPSTTAQSFNRANRRSRRQLSFLFGVRRKPHHTKYV
jgi:transcriptional regulator with XRE-family HTH domain